LPTWELYSDSMLRGSHSESVATGASGRDLRVFSRTPCIITPLVVDIKREGDYTGLHPRVFAAGNPCRVIRELGDGAPPLH
jgi:hypothetical protein